MSWNCPLCSWFGAPTMKHVLRHIGAVHAHDASFHVCCGIAGCPRTYKKFHSYRQHLYRHHRDAIDGITSSTPAHNSFEDDNYSDSKVTSPDDVSDSVAFLSKKEAGLFLLKTKEVYKVSQSNLDSLIDDISTIVDLTVKHLEDNVHNELKRRGIEMNTELRQIFQSPRVNHIFQAEFLRKKFVRENLNLVVSLSTL